jgi:hypothetical protein
MMREFFEHNRMHGDRASAFVCVGVLLSSVVRMRNVHVVTTNPLDFASLNRSIAACICDVAIAARMANGTPIGRWWRAIEPIEGPGNAW